ncbi:cAMP-specific 3',5'-cyclic phosphodiesterase [Gryllus bimaculatus]|nr:cAMP-specific 3',5'-cyclic phosphodiesterase [Gryllus bimaculatus]
MQHCGICSVLAELFRRIMCINRRGSGDTYNPDSGDDDSGRGVVTIKHTEDHGIVIHVVDPVAPTTRNRKLSDSDWLLLETLDKRCQRPLYTRRFLTMHKRRRKKLTTRLLTLEPALLDDIQHGQVQCVLDRVWQWPFNAFTLDTVTGGRSLPVLCVHLFHWYGLLDHFNLDVVRVWKLFTLVEEGYHSTNPYHNSIHATDVTQAMHCFLQEDKIQKHLTPLEIMSSLIAAVTHDLDHPGVNQPFLIATSNHLAALYENTSVLENHHWRSAIGCLLESRVAEQLGPSKCELEHQISSLILATDITRQQEFLTRFKRYLDQSLLDMHRVNDRHFILQIALKCADISNPCRPWDVSRKWSQKVCEEFFRQGDYERQLNLPVTSLCDRQTTSVPKIQAGFFRFVVSPLFEEWHRFLGTKLSHLMMKHLRGNQGKWEAMVEKELAEETHTEVSDADVLDEEVECNSEEEAQDFVTGSVEMLIPNLPSHQATAASSDDKYIRKIGRRHSVPLSVPRPPPFAQTIIRRESLPVGDSKSKRSSPTSNLTLETRPERKEHGSSLSLVSSCSGSGLQHSSGRRSKQENRPVSTENLLPEPSIASITTSVEASRLSSVLHGASSSVSRSVLAPSTLGPARFLTRQQTFPPLQQYVRIRYMSTTAEMANCSEPLTGIGSYSNSSTSSHVDFVSNVPSRRASEAMADSQSSPESTGGCKNGCGTPTGRPRALQHNNRTSVEQLFQCTSGCSVESDRDTSLRFMCKKEQTDQTELLRDKSSNGSKICDTTLLQQITSGKVMTSDDYGKENVDPRNSGSDVDQDINISGSKNSILRRNSHQGLVQRRGSAPVGLLSRSDDNSGPTTFPLRGEGDRFLRRGHRDGGDNRSNDSGVGRQNLLAINLRMPECCLPSASTHHRYVGCKQQFTECE